MFGQHDDKPKDDGFKQDDDILSDQSPDVAVKPDATEADNDSEAKDKAWQHPGAPLNHFSGGNDDTNVDKPSSDIFKPSSDQSKLEADDASEPSPLAHINPAPSIKPSSASADSTDDLIDIKQEALGKLTPLVGHLDQSNEDKFRTLMMMIQASDDQSLIKSAYETALKIDDEKGRAQALLDIVNEINYFTQNPAKSE